MDQESTIIQSEAPLEPFTLKRPRQEDDSSAKKQKLEFTITGLTRKCLSIFMALGNQPEWKRLEHLKWHAFIIELADPVLNQKFELFTPYRQQGKQSQDVTVPKNNLITGEPDNAVYRHMFAFKVKADIANGFNKLYGSEVGSTIQRWMAKSKNTQVAVMEHRGACSCGQTQWHYHVLLAHTNEAPEHVNMIKEATSSKFHPFKLTKKRCSNPIQALAYMAKREPETTYLGSTDPDINTLVQMAGEALGNLVDDAKTINYPLGEDEPDEYLNPLTGLPLDLSNLPGTSTAMSMVSAALSTARQVSASDKRAFKLEDDRKKLLNIYMN